MLRIDRYWKRYLGIIINKVKKIEQEPLWRLPVTEEHSKLMKGKHSDLCNMGSGKFEGSQRAAAFLS